MIEGTTHTVSRDVSKCPFASCNANGVGATSRPPDTSGVVRRMNRATPAGVVATLWCRGDTDGVVATRRRRGDTDGIVATRRRRGDAVWCRGDILSIIFTHNFHSHARDSSTTQLRLAHHKAKSGARATEARRAGHGACGALGDKRGCGLVGST